MYNNSYGYGNSQSEIRSAINRLKAEISTGAIKDPEIIKKNQAMIASLSAQLKGYKDEDDRVNNRHNQRQAEEYYSQSRAEMDTSVETIKARLKRLNPLYKLFIGRTYIDTFRRDLQIHDEMGDRSRLREVANMSNKEFRDAVKHGSL